MTNPYEQFNAPEVFDPQASPPVTNVQDKMALIQEAVNQENHFNSLDVQNSIDSYYNNDQAALGVDPSFNEEQDDYNNFIEEEIVPVKKKKKPKYNDSKERINSLAATVEKERAEKEAALMRLEITEKENQRIKDVNEYLALNQKREKLELEEDQLSHLWKMAHERGDIEDLPEISKDLSKISALKDQYENDIELVKSRYQNRYEEEQEQDQFDNKLQLKQQEALDYFSDSRELKSPLYKGFLQHHNFLDPFDTVNYDANLVERVEPIKYDLIQELKLNGQSDEIGTTEYFEELSQRIHENLNPRYKKRDDVMRNNRYQEPDYNRIRDRLEQQTMQPSPSSPQQGWYPPQQGGYPPQQGGYPPQQGWYPPQQGGYPPQQGGYPQSSVAPVNRAGYQNNHMVDPNNINLSPQQKAVADLFAGPISEMTQAVYGRSTDREGVYDLYRQNLAKQYQNER